MALLAILEKILLEDIMKKLLLVLILFPDIVLADALTPTFGCFIENNSFYCAQGTITCGADPVQNAFDFGMTAADLCTRLNAATDSNTHNYNGWNSCITMYNSTESSRQEWIAYGTRQAALIKKLRRACGTRCRGIK